MNHGLVLDIGGQPLVAPSLASVEGAAAGAVRDAFCTTAPVSPKTLWEWEQLVKQASPRHDHLSWLYPVYEPGWPWEPVGRMMLFETYPNDVVNPDFLTELQGPDPAQLTTRDPFTGVINQKTMVTAMQWRIYQKIGRLAKPFWVVQGDGGGHKVFFSTEEKKLLRMAGYPDSLPAPGELPWAPIDERVIGHIHRYDKLRKASGNVRRMQRMSAAGAGLMRQAHRKKIVDWLGGQIEDAAKAIIKEQQANDAPQDRTQLTPETVMDEQLAHYVEGGKFLDVR